MKTVSDFRNPHYLQTIALCGALVFLFGQKTSAQPFVPPADTSLDEQFARDVRPLISQYCLDCHSHDEPAAKLNLAEFRTADSVSSAHKTWAEVLRRVTLKEMPPDDAAQPTARQRQSIVEWIQAIRRRDAERHKGDPGFVPVRRLTTSEYNDTIRDLTGVDIRPTSDFPVDPANTEGFDNTGESLTMSPALLNKYLAAARNIAEHMVLTPTGLTFAPWPVRADTDRDKFCVRRIVEFYRRQPTDLTDYFFAAWQYQQAEHADVSRIADEHQISARYLKTVLTLLTEPDAVGPIAEVQQRFRQLPSSPDQARKSCRQLTRYVNQLRQQLVPVWKHAPQVEGIHQGSQTFVLWRNRFRRDHRRSLNIEALARTEKSLASDSADSTAVPALSQDESLRQRQIAAFRRFCSVFPDAFYVSERGRDYVSESKKQEGERGRLLSAGFHSMPGYFRDDRPLYELILTDQQQKKLDRLWDELNFITAAPIRQYQGFLWFERTDSRYMRDPQFDFARPENPAATGQQMIRRLAEEYLQKAQQLGAGDVETAAIRDYFREINDQIRWVETQRQKSEPTQLHALLQFAQKAWRRPLTDEDRQQLRDFYDDQRRTGATHDEALQDTLVTILMSPPFLYRLDLLAPEPGVQELTDTELASRLSYFVWNSLPDDRLLNLAAAGRLKETRVLKRELRRMLRDPRVRGLAVEFSGQWLDFRRFQQHNAVDRARFPQFNDALREAMFEEPVRFFMDVVKQDRSILDFLYAKDTFVNTTLANHYRIPIPHPSDDDAWHHVPDATEWGRGGLLTMAVFLTKNSPGLRTSPVKRGYWVVRRLLGEHIPPPPPDVPELPADERRLEDMTVRQALERHRADPACAGCHQRIDSVGLAFEGFDPIGQHRTQDAAGRPIDDAVDFADGISGQGPRALTSYLQAHRQNDFADNFCRKLLAYALNRGLILSDDLLIEEMRQKLQTHGYRFSVVAETIVTSPQFRSKRGHTQTGN